MKLYIEISIKRGCFIHILSILYDMTVLKIMQLKACLARILPAPAPSANLLFSTIYWSQNSLYSFSVSQGGPKLSTDTALYFRRTPTPTFKPLAAAAVDQPLATRDRA
jgi:hypothetical protein